MGFEPHGHILRIETNKRNSNYVKTYVPMFLLWFNEELFSTKMN